MTDTINIYEQTVFVNWSVADIRDLLLEYEDGDFPLLEKLTDLEMYNLIKFVERKYDHEYPPTDISYFENVLIDLPPDSLKNSHQFSE